MSSEQGAVATEVNRVAQLESFVASRPETQGVYAGGPLEADGVYISPAAVPAATPVEQLPRLHNVDVIPGAQLGAADSQNGVAFGELEFSTAGEASRTRVAIKPFTPGQGDSGRDERATHEHDRLREAAALGFDTLKPLALMKDGGTNYLVTEFRPDIMTLDNVDWTISPSDPRYEAELLPSLHFIADHMGETHGKGLFNGDPQVKNFAKTDTGEAIVIDLESATIASSPDEHVALLSGGYDIRDSLAYQDARQFWFTLTRGIGTDGTNIYLGNEDFDTFMGEFENNFLEPYMQSLQKHTPDAVASQISLDALRQGIYEHTARMG